MNILGVSYGYHDASAALVVDGSLVFASAEERHSRVKHDPSFPSSAIDQALKHAGLKPSDIDAVAFHEDPINKLSRSMVSSLSGWPFSFSSFAATAQEAIQNSFWVAADIATHLGIDSKVVHSVPHHLSHTAMAFHGAQCSAAAVMTIDAVGEWTCSTITKVKKTPKGTQYQLCHASPFPHSLGLFYSAFTAFLGFRVNHGECSLMALASFGEPRFKDEVEALLHVTKDGTHQLNLDYFDFSSAKNLPINARFIQSFGAPRPFKSPLVFSAFGDATDTPCEDQRRYADVASSVQYVTTAAVAAYAAKAHKETGLKTLAYGGGVALNCVANAALLRQGRFERVSIPTDPGDGGGAAGAALALSDKLDAPSKTQVAIGPFLGSIADADSAESILGALSPEKWHRFSLLSPQPLAADGLKWERLSDPAELIARAIALIASGGLLAWVQGRFESGPRALGGRSILARADDISVAQRLSKRVKLRAGFRPYAASMTQGAAERLLFLEPGGDYRKMQTAAKVRPEHAHHIAAAMHIDQTTRPQVVSPTEQPHFHALLVASGKAMGEEVLLNTSLNEQGEPLVASAIDAIAMFARTDLDALVINDLFISKERNA